MFTDWDIDKEVTKILEQAMKDYPPLPKYIKPKRQQVEEDIKMMHTKFSDWINIYSIDETKQKMQNWLKDFIKIFESSSTNSYNAIKSRQENQNDGDLFEYYANIMYVRKVLETGLNEEREKSEKSLLKNLPPKIILLDMLGFFKLSEVEKLTTESKAKLVSALCGGNADNAADYIRYCDPNKNTETKNPYNNPANKKIVLELLAQLNKE